MKFFQLSILLWCISLGSAWNVRAQSVVAYSTPGGRTTGADHDSGRRRLNLSRDLVRLGIAPQNLTPDDPSLDARPLFQAALHYVEQNHTPLVTVDRGTYYFLTPQNPETYLSFSGLSDLRMNLAGSRIYSPTHFCRAS